MLSAKSTQRQHATRAGSKLEKIRAGMIYECVRAARVDADHRNTTVAGVVHNPLCPGAPLGRAGNEARTQRVTGECTPIEARGFGVGLHDVRDRPVAHTISDAAVAVDAAKDRPTGDCRGLEPGAKRPDRARLGVTTDRDCALVAPALLVGPRPITTSYPAWSITERPVVRRLGTRSTRGVAVSAMTIHRTTDEGQSMGFRDKVQNLIGRGLAEPPPSPNNNTAAVDWLPDDKNRWGVPVLDVAPVTQTMVCVTSDKNVAATFASMMNNDGTVFAREEPIVDRIVETELRYRAEGPLPPGVLFLPRVMEHKWAIYYHAHRLIFVRTWQRRVFVTADVRFEGGHAVVGPVRGAFDERLDPPAFTVRLLDWFVRSHALRMIWPVPVPARVAKRPRDAAMWCIGSLGNMALVATPHEVPAEIPTRPLRVDSLLHIAVARGERAKVAELLQAGLDFSLRAVDGLTPVHWALNANMLTFCLDQGAPVDVRSEEGATPLMQAAQARSRDQMALLLARGADPNATDDRGFTALHRAAEMGEIELVRLLIEHGALRSPEAGGHTPRSLAEKRGQAGIVKLLS